MWSVASEIMIYHIIQVFFMMYNFYISFPCLFRESQTWWGFCWDIEDSAAKNSYTSQNFCSSIFALGSNFFFLSILDSLYLSSPYWIPTFQFPDWLLSHTFLKCDFLFFFSKRNFLFNVSSFSLSLGQSIWVKSVHSEEWHSIQMSAVLSQWMPSYYFFHTSSVRRQCGGAWLKGI